MLMCSLIFFCAAENSRRSIALKRLMLLNAASAHPRLFGPFGLWAHAVHPTKTPRHAAYLRMLEVHRLAETCPELHANDHLREAVGWFQNSHVPLATLHLTDSPDDPPMHEVYRRNLDPEHHFKIDCVRESPEFITSLRIAWGCYGIVPDVSDDADSQVAQVVGLLLKGMPQPVSIRYILGKLEGLAESGGFAAVVVSDILLKHFTGAHRGRRRMCGPARRCALMQMPAIELVGQAARYHSRQLYSILAEYVVKAARYESLTWEVCLTRYPAFTAKVCAMTIEHDDVPATSPSVHCPLGAAATTGLLMLRNILKVKKKVPAWAAAIIDPACIQTAVKLGQTNRGLSARALVAAGVSEIRAMAMIVVVKKKSDVQKLLESMTPRERAVLSCYVAGVVRADVTVLPLAAPTTTKQIMGGLAGGHDLGQIILFCKNCQKPLPKSKAIAGGPKATAGCTVDVDQGTVLCISCGRPDGLKAVRMLGNLVVARVKVTGSRQCIATCAVCCHPCCPIVWRGVAPLCVKCNARRNDEAAPCYAAGCKKVPLPRPILLRIAPGKSVHVYACGRHSGKILAAGPERRLEDVKNWSELYKRGKGGRMHGRVRSKQRWRTHR